MPLPSWATFMLERFSSGQLQAGIDVATPMRVYKRQVREGDRDFKIVKGTKRVAGTKIPASTFSRFKSGQWTPRKATLTKLRRMYVRYTYQTLRSQGLSTSQAKRYSGQTPANVASLIHEYLSHIKTVAEAKGVDLLYITWGFMESGRDREDWDSYVREKRYRQRKWVSKSHSRTTLRPVRPEPIHVAEAPYPSPAQVRRAKKRRRRKKGTS